MVRPFRVVAGGAALGAVLGVAVCRSGSPGAGPSDGGGPDAAADDPAPVVDGAPADAGLGAGSFLGETPWPTVEAAEIAVAAWGDRAAMAANSREVSGFDIGVSCSADLGESWLPAGTPSSGVGPASDPSLAYDSTGRLYLAWLRTGPGNAFDIRVAVSDDGCATWSAPVALTGQGGLGSYDHPWITVVADRAFVVYFNAGTVRVTEATGGVKGATSTVGAASWAFIHGGRKTLWVYATGGTGGPLVFRSDDFAATWAPRVQVSAEPVLGGSGMGLGGDEDALVLAYTRSGTPRHVEVVRSIDAGATWSTAERASGDAGGFFPWPVVAGGKVFLLMYAGVPGAAGQVQLVEAPLDGPFGAPSVVDDAAFPSGWQPQVTDRRLGDYIQMAASRGRLVLGWTHAPVSAKGKTWSSNRFATGG